MMIMMKLSPLELEEAHKHIQYMLEHRFIRPSDSLYGAPVLFAPKKDGGLWFCIDYDWLNKRTVRNCIPCHYWKDVGPSGWRQSI